MEFIFGFLILGAIVAMVAKSKGRSAAGWFFYGFFLFPIALVHALLLRQAEDTLPGFGPEPRRPRTIPYPSSASGNSTSPSGATDFGSSRKPAQSDQLDAETLKIAAEWRAVARQFTMIEAKEEARLRLLEKANQQPPPEAEVKSTRRFEPDPFRRAMFPGAFPDDAPGGPPPPAADKAERPQT
ncbi:MAG: hypothetical protein INF98_12910 [Roseomonas sp.]|nr:hypothetical protein [Roseomonas sp.]